MMEWDTWVAVMGWLQVATVVLGVVWAVSVVFLILWSDR